MPMTRGRLLKTGFAGGLVLALAGCARSGGSPFRDDAAAYKVLDGTERGLIAALAPAFLAGALPTANGVATHDALVAAVRGFDTALSGLPPVDVAQIRKLLGMLDNPFIKPLATGVWSSWGDASPATVTAFLNRWRFSPIELLRGGYDVLHQLTMAGWYGQDRAWSAIGYPGPPRLS
ncbi:MAG: hypothetical protein HKL92_01080 [Candidatus Eremiobacteraeota bacterium]|uniref:Twin-arginine translocation pathway signal protein n=1 Tax=mine drainage metagenome TaxID=410659 RepID=E6Q2W5_9ZZZZ|nr:hypothetical protein [Candidatus Eremiobacteraeota bacterium]NNM91913.1 hypothetical protein [Candidatus Eremiobacteraeota bacterium]